MSRRRQPARGPASLRYDVVGIGASWGGVELLSRLVAALPADWPLPVVIVQHQHANSGKALERILGKLTSLPVVDVEDKDRMEPGHVYIAPANYHLLLEQDDCFSLSMEAPVNYSRPSVDVTFMSLAAVHRSRCIGVVLTGANNDGAEGLRAIHAFGGHAIAQDPLTAEAAVMPAAAIATGVVDAVLHPDEIVPYLLRLL